ncbi:AraC family transcriptional regulator [Xanthobacteraceae bacterium Astr-EGSB]|uniref:AraC family transcriptional regulator n=1 Tax=Astrobacterium formosum TaxID=3069710 RepID=UPI0027B58C2E|nr:AraC family transcriptional regulator [Xanthobacteraceae bacterium Astr-EGSB]
MRSRSERPLDRFPMIRTGNSDELERVLAIEFGVNRFDPSLGDNELYAWINRLRIGAVDFTYSKFSVRTDIAFKADDIVRLQFGLRGTAVARVGASRLFVSENGACVTPAYFGLEQRWEPEFERLVLRISEQALRRKLEAILGIEIHAPVQFEFASNIGHPNITALREFALEMLSDPDTSVPDSDDVVRSELGQTWMVALLYGAAHNYSDLLTSEPLRGAPGQVRLAVDYIEANWNRPLMIEDLAAAIGISSRSLFKTFKATFGTSPMAYVRTVRLKKANAMLLRASHETTVGGIARACGFLNAGHFAKDYRDAFGESPSATLGRARTLMRSRRMT